MKKFLYVLLLLPGLIVAQKPLPVVAPPSIPEPNTYKKIHVQLPASPSVDALNKTLQGVFPVLTSKGSSFIVASQLSSPGGHHFLLEETYLGLKVYNSQIKLNLNNDWMAISVLSHIQDFSPTISGSFVYSEDQALDVLKTTYAKGQAAFRGFAEKQYLAESGVLKPVFVCWFYGNDITGSLEVIYDGQTLLPLQARDRASYFHNLPVDTTVKGLVFNPDPLTTSMNYYGGSYVDNNDNDVTVLNNERDTVDLKDITYNAGTFSLVGPFCQIEDIESPSTAPVTSTSPTFYYTRAQSGFEDVNVYYHIDTYQRWIQSLGFTNLQNTSFRVDPHGLSGADNSHFVPAGASSYVALGEGGVDDAEDADVIVHEYGHGISYAGSPGTNTGFERQGLDEGIGDYMQASYSRSISTFRWEDTFTWDGHNTFWDGRSAVVTTTYPFSASSFYDYGEVWASVMMQIWGDLGRTVTDRLFFQELYANVSGMTLADAAENVMDADTLLYAGANSNTLLYWFCDRGLISGTRCLSVSLDKPTFGGALTLYPNPTSGMVTVGMDGIDQYTIPVTVTDLTGKIILTMQVRHGDQIDLSSCTSGMYLITWEGSDGLVTKKLIKE